MKKDKDVVELTADFADEVRDLAIAKGLSPRALVASLATMMEFLCMDPSTPPNARKMVAQWAREFANNLDPLQ